MSIFDDKSRPYNISQRMRFEENILSYAETVKVNQVLHANASWAQKSVKSKQRREPSYFNNVESIRRRSELLKRKLEAERLMFEEELNKKGLAFDFKIN